MNENRFKSSSPLGFYNIFKYCVQKVVTPDDFSHLEGSSEKNGYIADLIWSTTDMSLTGQDSPAQNKEIMIDSSEKMHSQG